MEKERKSTLYRLCGKHAPRKSDTAANLRGRESAHLWVFLDRGGRLIPDAGVVQLGGDHFQQIERVVDPGGGEALDLLGLAATLARALRRHSGHIDRIARSSSDGIGAHGLGLPTGFFRVRLWWGFLCAGGCLFLCEQSCVLLFAGLRLFALRLAVFLGFVGFCALYPFVLFCPFLERGTCPSI